MGWFTLAMNRQSMMQLIAIPKYQLVAQLPYDNDGLFDGSTQQLLMQPLPLIGTDLDVGCLRGVIQPRAEGAVTLDTMYVPPLRSLTVRDTIVQDPWLRGHPSRRAHCCRQACHYSLG